MKRTCFSLLPVILLVLNTYGHVEAQTSDLRRIISVSGESRVQVEPDIVFVRFGIVARDDDPEETRRQNDEAAAAAMNAVRNLGVAERKIRMDVLRLNEVREYDQQTRRQEIRGYEATRQVTVELEDIERMPDLVTYVVQEGANRLHGITYDTSRRESVQNEALQAAVVNARTKAGRMLRAVDAALGQVISINEQTFDFPRPVVRADVMAEMAMDRAAPEPDAYAAGEITVRAVVQVSFEIE